MSESEIETRVMPFVDSKLPLDDHSTVGGSNGGAPANIVDLIKRDLQDIEQSEFVFIPIPGYESTRLSVRYSLPEKGEMLDEIVRNIEREFKGASRYTRNLYMVIDTMTRLCAGLYVQPVGETERYKLDPEKTGEPADFGDLPRILNWTNVESARDAVRKLFSVRDIVNEQAILSHGEKLNRWLSDTKADISKEFWQSGE